MRSPSLTRAEFINGVFTSRLPGQLAKRFSFADGEVGVLYTIGRDPVSGQSCPVVLYIATFPPSARRASRLWHRLYGAASRYANGGRKTLSSVWP